MEKFYYLIINVLVILFPVLFSFDKRVAFHEKFRPAGIAIGVTAFIFIIGDIFYTSWGIWGFNDQYLTGITLINLPLEEILFFITIPYACLFIYSTVKEYLNNKFGVIFSWIVYALVAILSANLLLQSFGKPYTTFACTVSLILCFWMIFNRPKYYRDFALSFLIALIPFVLVNGILTGTGIENEIVWYAPEGIYGFRTWTIPLEDYFYAFNLLLINVMIFEYISRKKSKRFAPKTN